MPLILQKLVQVTLFMSLRKEALLFASDTWPLRDDEEGLLTSLCFKSVTHEQFEHSWLEQWLLDDLIVTRRDAREMSFHNELNWMAHLPSDRSSVSAILPSEFPLWIFVGKFLLNSDQPKRSSVRKLVLLLKVSFDCKMYNDLHSKNIFPSQWWSSKYV